MGALDPATASKLVKICGLLASDQVGERAAAALQASALLKRHGCTWQDVLGPGTNTQQQQPVKPAATTREHRATAAWVLRYPAEISPWEAGFLLNLRDRRKPATVKQASILADIVDRLRKGGAV